MLTRVEQQGGGCHPSPGHHHYHQPRRRAVEKQGVSTPSSTAWLTTFLQLS